jgi:DNA topoisomerase-1
MAKTAKKSLVIVESPAKSKTINKYLGPDYYVTASMGHVRDLPSKGISVDIENGFKPTYAISPRREKTVKTLKDLAKKCDKLYLATDLDREGEAIAWHLSQILNFDEDHTFRVVFNAITKQAITKAFSAPGKVDIDKVNAQQARRILDRIVGYQISPLLWKKVTPGLSAGRVQSVAVKLVVEKEREIRAFVPVEYWLIPGVFSTDLQNDYSVQWAEFVKPKGEKQIIPTIAEQNQWLGDHNAFKADFYSLAGKKLPDIKEEQATQIFQALQNTDFKVASLETKESKSRPSPPFITSTLQQAASTRLGFNTKRTMRIAQQLYEGIDLGSMGSLGLITYMRTDSTNLSPEALNDARNYIKNKFGENYIPEKPNFYSSKKGAQEAHEAIRVTDPDLAPEDIAEFLTDEQFKLYDLIWRRFLSCQMSPARWDVTNLEVEAETSIGACRYRTTGRILIFDGFTRLWQRSSNDQILPAVETGQPVDAVSIESQQHFTKPPARYNEASLVKALEKEGIGRPSTYASIITTIQDRKYVEQLERKFYATDMGEVVTEKLDEFFPQIMNVAFTRYMEEQLDKIEEQHLDWVAVLDEFYGPFSKNLETAKEEMTHAKAESTPSEYKCPDCDKQLVYKFGRNGRFLGCQGYPDCKFTSPCDREGKMVADEVTEHICPLCSKPMIKKRGRFGEFLGCSGYPDCKQVQKIDKQGNVLPPKPPAEPTGIKCHKCEKGELVIRQSKRGPFLGCNKFPRCRTIVSMEKLEQLKELTENGQWPPKTEKEIEAVLGKKKTAKKKTAKKKTTKKKTAKKKATKTTAKKTASKIKKTKTDED